MAKLVGVVFSGLSALSIEGVEEAGDVIVVRASTRGDEVACPVCGRRPAGFMPSTSGSRRMCLPMDGEWW
jgi:hypothetical protein